MTRNNFDKACITLDRINKLKAIKEKIKREFSEFEYDKESKIIGDAIYQVLDSMLSVEQKTFDEL